MSENFIGVTFAEQKVSPSDDAIIRRSILADGILTGCEFSYSGSTLTMAPGQLIMCGRQIRHISAQNWAVVDATSGYARLLITIDLTQTSTKDVFRQIIPAIEYAASADGFPALEQSDINAAGVRYQIVACVVSLGIGGITGIVSSLDSAKPLGAQGGAEALAAMLAAGYMVLSPYQIVDSVEAIPADAPDGAVFLLPMEG